MKISLLLLVRDFAMQQRLASCRPPSAGVLREGHRYLDGRVSAVRVLRPAGVRRRQLHRPPTQGAAALQTEAATHEGEYARPRDADAHLRSR